MKYQIVEDCSPYYIRFTWDSLSELIEFVKNQPLDPSLSKVYDKCYTHWNYDSEVSNKILNKLPMNNSMRLNKNRVSVFETPPGQGCGIHKDSSDHRMSINIPIQISDSDCITNWYDDSLFENHALIGDAKFQQYSRNVFTNYKLMDKFPTLKTMIALPNEAILFNTEIYHSWSNINSKNHRKILTLRSVDPGNMYFEDARKILFNY
jgi:hypothetical protein